jgi:glutathione S-transferase
VRKIRVLLAEKKLDYDFVLENPWDPATRVPDANPLGKVPAFVSGEGEVLFDSPVIAEYVDTLAAPRFIPAAGIERVRAKRDEALGDGIADAGITIFLERKREGARQDEAWMARQRGKVDAGIAMLARDLGEQRFLRGSELSLGDVACGCALFWVDFRMPEVNWRATHANLKAWAERLEARPSFTETRPQLA